MKNIIMLNSVGGAINTVTGNLYAQLLKGGIDEDSAVHVTESVPEWYKQLSKEDRGPVDQMLNKFNMHPDDLINNVPRFAVVKIK